MGIENQRAEVAELVDALGSGSSGRTPVRVQIPASAPNENRGLADSSVSPFLIRGGVGQRFGQHFPENLPFGQQLSGHNLNQINRVIP